MCLLFRALPVVQNYFWNQFSNKVLYNYHVLLRLKGIQPNFSYLIYLGLKKFSLLPQQFHRHTDLVVDFINLGLAKWLWPQDTLEGDDISKRNSILPQNDGYCENSSPLAWFKNDGTWKYVFVTTIKKIHYFFFIGRNAPFKKNIIYVSGLGKCPI